MRKAAAFTLLAIYLFSITEAYQLLKFPILLEHFREHTKGNKGITFQQFLDIHYMHGSPMDADYNRDMQLPFKTINLHSNTISTHIKDLTIANYATSSALMNEIFIISNVRRLHSKYSSPVFQPPRAC